MFHSALILGWIVFAVGAWFVLRRVRFDPRRALIWPMVFMLVDFGTFTLLGITTAAPPRPQMSVAVFAILEVFAVVPLSRLHVWLSAAFASIAYFVHARFGRHPFFDWRGVEIAIACYVCIGTVVVWANRRLRSMFIELQQRQNLERLLPRQVVQRIMAAGGQPLEPVQREVTILFSDIRDSTSMSERMQQREVLALLDEYFERMSAIVKAHEGMVNKFIGDGRLALWGAPDPLPDHAQRAVACALEMQRGLAQLNQARASSGAAPLRIGIGVHTGTVAAGMLGGPDQSEYTVIGDAVNLASRIETLTKSHHADVLASEPTWNACGGDLSASAWVKSA